MPRPAVARSVIARRRLRRVATRRSTSSSETTGAGAVTTAPRRAAMTRSVDGDGGVHAPLRGSVHAPIPGVGTCADPHITIPRMARTARGAGRLRQVLTAPGAAPLLAARSFGATPMGMVPLGIVLLLRAAGRSYALAGVADGAFALGFAFTGPLFGRVIDRVGMSRVLAPLAVAFP